MTGNLLARTAAKRQFPERWLKGCLLCYVLCGWASIGTGQDRWTADAGRDRIGISTDGNWQGNNWLGGTNNSGEWTLGVRGDSTDTGFLVSHVTSGGPADRARIQPGDRIVTVDGYQVGILSERLHDLTTEINRRADSTGALRLLLQDGQSGRLATVRVQLDDQSQRLTGRLVLSQSLPSDATVTVQIENLTRPQYGVRNGQQVFFAPNQREIPFQIAYDPQYIFSQDIYQVRAFVSAAGRNVFYTPRPARVLTQGNPSQVTMVLEPVTALAGYTDTGGGTVTGYSNYNDLDDEVKRIYQRYLGRLPSATEMAAARILGNDAKTLQERLPLKLMASQDYYDLARNDNNFWLANVFGVIVGREASEAELEQWRRRFADLRFSRTELLRQLYQQAR